jgi:manganese/zinc/iron transport system ATP- binding protein
MESAISVNNLTVTYSRKPVVWGVSFELQAGSSVAIVGPNGAGKSSLLKAVMGLLPASSGDVKFFGQSLNSKRSILAYVPQREEVDWDFPINVYDVVMMGRTAALPFYKRPSITDHQAVESALAEMGLKDLATRQIRELSGGQQQRVFLARALAQEALIYLLDEPFAGVDVATEKALVELFEKLTDEGKTIVCVHHDLSTVKSYFDHLILINLRLVASGPVETTFTLENLQLAYGGRVGLFAEVAETIDKRV